MDKCAVEYLIVVVYNNKIQHSSKINQTYFEDMFNDMFKKYIPSYHMLTEEYKREILKDKYYRFGDGSFIQAVRI
jgi:hypothetical protein